MTLGMQQAGWDVVYSADHNREFIQTSVHNFDHRVQYVQFENAMENVDAIPVDLDSIGWVHGRPPCRGFTRANNKRDISNPLNIELYKFCMWAEIIHPPVITIENVPDLLSINNTADTADHTLVDRLETWYDEAGYELVWKLHDARDYGTAQKRRRVLCVGIRKDLPTKLWQFPDGSYKPSEYRTKGDALHDLPDPHSDHNIPNHVPVNHSERIVQQLQDLDCGPANRDASYNRAPCDEPAYTLICRQPVHCCEPRRLTIREMARLMDFPDDHEFVGNKPARLGVGTTVPVRMATAFSNAVKDYLERVDKQTTL
jgi:DNA (cytosine-5)-methyltransferase 1